jgi:predicted lipid-binding transport protein (Tim44 family)
LSAAALLAFSFSLLSAAALLAFSFSLLSAAALLAFSFSNIIPPFGCSYQKPPAKNGLYGSCRSAVKALQISKENFNIFNCICKAGAAYSSGTCG